MKKTSFFLIVMLLFALFPMNVWASPVGKELLNPNKDAFIDGTGYFEDGDGGELFVGGDPNNGVGNEKVALQYDISSIDTEKINSIILRIDVVGMQHFPETQPAELNIYASSQMDDWHTSFPTSDSALLAHVSNIEDAIGGFSGDLEVELDVSEATSYLQSGYLTFVIKGSGNDSVPNFFYFVDSSNTGGYPAQLEVTYAVEDEGVNGEILLLPGLNDYKKHISFIANEKELITKGDIIPNGYSNVADIWN